MCGNIKQEVFQPIELFVKDIGRAVSVAVSIKAGPHTNGNGTLVQRLVKKFLVKKWKKRYVYHYFKVACKLLRRWGRGKLRHDEASYFS